MNNGHITWISKNDSVDAFPPASAALSEPDGLLAVGGDLSVDRLIHAYKNGIFPWFDENQPVMWWSPSTRCVLLPNNFHTARSLKRKFKNSNIIIKVNSAFSAVIRECAKPRRSMQGTWITEEMIKAYELLHFQGWAHSIEIWKSNDLVGGLYGVAIGRIFFGESMFSHSSNASKISLLFIANHLNSGALELLDCQIVSAHLLKLGATQMPRSEFIKNLNDQCDSMMKFKDWHQHELMCSELFDKYI
ncbi:MAG: leucyl/phenylalanyl-tRNA--protein transferase [Woeseia sp.]|nr:leucyl/phenylalanyl-tRNA--protein transferase [Woeseia sp.]|tara:strand:+ start:4814 stop:5554 length:741 start_codon:yes stop_codon:yes gene_type:complete